MYVLLKWNRLHIGVLNIYAPNSAPERAIFWRMLATTLPNAEAWVMAGDFNMTEHSCVVIDIYLHDIHTHALSFILLIEYTYSNTLYMFIQTNTYTQLYTTL